MTTDDSNAPELAVEFHYTDGDVGVYSVEPGSPDAGLWGQFPSIAGSAPSHIALRPNTDEGHDISNRLYAAGKPYTPASSWSTLTREAWKTAAPWIGRMSTWPMRQPLGRLGCAALPQTSCLWPGLPRHAGTSGFTRARRGRPELPWRRPLHLPVMRFSRGAPNLHVSQSSGSARGLGTGHSACNARKQSRAHCQPSGRLRERHGW